jgi:phage tail protein X
VILTADAETVRRTNRRETPNGWNTAFIGVNKNTIKPGVVPPPEDALHPVAFLVEKGPGGVTRPHFHRADQYQVVVGGYGKMGLHDTGSIAVHYTDAFSAYGPIVAAGDGIAWFTLRAGWDPGAKYMENPDNRAELRASRGLHTHWEAVTDPVPPLAAGDLASTASVASELVLEGEHGLATWRYRLPAGATLTGPDPAASGGQFWLVVGGTLAAAGSAYLGVNSTIFVAPNDGGLAVTAGPSGAEALCLQFRVPYARRH